MITIHIVFSLDLTVHSIQDNSSLFWQLLEIKNKQSWAKSLERNFTIRSIQIKLPIFDHFLLIDSRIYLVNLIYKFNTHTAFETASMPRYIYVCVCVCIEVQLICNMVLVSGYSSDSGICVCVCIYIYKCFSDYFFL